MWIEKNYTVQFVHRILCHFLFVFKGKRGYMYSFSFIKQRSLEKCLSRSVGVVLSASFFSITIPRNWNFTGFKKLEEGWDYLRIGYIAFNPITSTSVVFDFIQIKLSVDLLLVWIVIAHLYDQITSCSFIALSGHDLKKFSENNL